MPTDRIPMGFNGAALVRARRGTGCAVSHGGAWRCFNGAALVRARREPLPPTQFQEQDGASMEPRSLERGENVILGGVKPDGVSFNGAALVRARRAHWPLSVCIAQAGFNGAALVRARRAGVPHKQAGNWQASMEPRSLERGEQEFPTNRPEIGRLQWSRAR